MFQFIKYISATVLLFSLFSLTAQFTADQKECMEIIIAEDSEAGKIRNHACEAMDLSATIRQYTSSIESLDFSSCPEEFSLAFKNHIHAWKDLIAFTDEFPDLRGEMHELFKEIEDSPQGEAFKNGVQLIWDTWAEVEQHYKQ